LEMAVKAFGAPLARRMSALGLGDRPE